jgi:dTDP-4-amino-4,6-dideoxygalactose transaminase
MFKYCLFGVTDKGHQEKVENQLKENTDSSFALSVNQGRVGIYAAIKAAIEASGKKEVILSPYTLFEVVNMVIYAGGKPIFVDTLPNSTFVSASSIESLISDNTAAILLTHYHMPVPDTLVIADLAKNHGVYLVEDAAVSFAATLDGKAIGTFGDVGCYSFGLFKVINGFYGGAIISDNKDMIIRIKDILSTFKPESRRRLLSRVFYGLALDVMTHPLIFNIITFPMIRYGFRSKNQFIVKFTRADTILKIDSSYPEFLQKLPSETQSQVVLPWILKSEDERKLRENRARRYIEALGDIEELVIPEMPAKGVCGSWTEFPIVYKNRESLYAHFLLEGRDVRYYYYRNCANLEIFNLYKKDCPNANNLMLNTLMLPLYPRYGDQEIERNIASIKRFFD